MKFLMTDDLITLTTLINLMTLTNFMNLMTLTTLMNLITLTTDEFNDWYLMSDEFNCFEDCRITTSMNLMADELDDSDDFDNC